MSRSEEYYGRTGLRGLARDVRWAFQDRTPIPFNRRLKATRAGFKPVSAVAYDFGHNDARDYLPDTSWWPLSKANGPAARVVLANKLLFYRQFRGELPMPTVYGYMAAGHVVPLPNDGHGAGGSGANDRGPFSSLAHVLDHLVEHGPLFVKPMDGDRGRGVHLLEARDGELLKDGRPLARQALLDFLAGRDGSMFVEKVEQAEYSERIFPQATNSLRLMVFGGAGTGGTPFMPVAGHRFGRTASAPVDNTAKGGLICSVDVGTGLLERGRFLAVGAPAYVYFDEHPDSGARLTGARIPGFTEIVERMLDFSSRHPYLAYVGWDIVVTDAGFKVLEANHHASLRIQVGYPYLKDERVVAFLEHHDLMPRHARAPSGKRVSKRGG